MGSHNLNCWVHLNGHSEEYGPLLKEAREAFDRADFPEIIRLMDRHFGQTQYSLKNLFRDEQRKLLNQILAATDHEIHAAYRLIADRHSPLLRFMAHLGIPMLEGLRIAVEVVLNSEIRTQFESDRLDAERVRSLVAECQACKVTLEKEHLAYACKSYLDHWSERLLKTPQDIELLRRLIEAAKLARELPFETNLWKPQNIYFEISRTIRPEWSDRAREGDDAAKLWEGLIAEFGEALGFAVPAEHELQDAAAAEAPKPEEPVPVPAG
jgi:hypothetical protein